MLRETTSRGLCVLFLSHPRTLSGQCAGTRASRARVSGRRRQSDPRHTAGSARAQRAGPTCCCRQRARRDFVAEGLEVIAAAKARALHERVQRGAEDCPADVDAYRHVQRHDRRRVVHHVLSIPSLVLWSPGRSSRAISTNPDFPRTLHFMRELALVIVLWAQACTAMQVFGAFSPSCVTVLSVDHQGMWPRSRAQLQAL